MKGLLSFSQRHFFWIALIALFMSYAAFELFFNAYAAFSADEFWFAHAIFKFKSGLPYRDFAPYKTVLGYYLLSFMTAPVSDQIATLVSLKNSLIVFNIIVFAAVIGFLQKYFQRLPVLLSVFFIFLSEIFLSYSTNIRVDLIAYWFCLFALLAVFNKRFLLAGVFIGLGFITCQKVVWYLLAMNVALLVEALLLPQRSLLLKRLFRFNLGAALPLIAYFLFWSFLSSFQTVYFSVFHEASAMYGLAWYGPARKLFWSVILLYNPLLFLLAPMTLLSIFVSFDADKHYRERLLAVTTALTLLLFLLPYNQVFPYYMQVTLPAFLMLYASFFDWLINLRQAKQFHYLFLNDLGVQCLLMLIFFVIVNLIFLLKLPIAYLVFATVPLLLGLFLLRHNPQFIALMTIPFIFVGIVYPTILFSAKLISVNGAYQRETLKTLRLLTQDGSDYVSGVDLFYDKSQPIAGLKHLMGPAIDYLYEPTPELKAVMLTALDEDPNVSIASIISNLKQSKVKFYVNNYRMRALPPALKDYFNNQFSHYWGSIYVYAPAVSGGNASVDLQFTGTYIVCSSETSIQLNKQTYPTNKPIVLKKGIYESQANLHYRLILQPDHSALKLNPLYAKDQWQLII